MAKKVGAAVASGLFNKASLEMAQANKKFITKQIAINDIIPNEKNEYNTDNIDDLALSIANVGLQQNLVVTEAEDKYRLITGHRRLLAVKKLVEQGNNEYKTVPCIVLNIDDIDLPISNELKELYALITTNAETRVLTDSEIMMQIRNLKLIYSSLAEKGVTLSGRQRDLIANDLGISSAQVGKYEYTDRNLVSEFKKELEQGNISMNTANDIAHLPVEEQVDLFKKEKASEITAKKIKKIIESQTYNNINNQGMRAVKQQLQNAENNLQLFRDNEKAFELQQEIILKCQELQDLLRKEEKR